MSRNIGYVTPKIIYFSLSIRILSGSKYATPQKKTSVKTHTHVQAAEASAARDAFESAERAVHEAMERAQLLAAENVALEEQLLQSKSDSLQAQQSAGEWDSRLSLERQRAVRAEECCSELGAAHDVEKQKLLDRLTELQVRYSQRCRSS